ncbi:MAG: flagellar motor switch protein FliN [Thermosediminibacterales bacterium]|nr:flagellar motor switch protein FliN [Thermosediminibacterales bacterium]
MNDNMLSQEEIDALLKDENSKHDENELDLKEQDALGEIGNISMGAAATALSTILGKKVKITTPKVSITTLKKLKEDYPIPFVAIEVKYTQGLEGTNIFVVKQDDAILISDLMMGGVIEGSKELDNIRLSALAEAMNQMMGSSATAMSTMLKKDINISPPKTNLLDFAKETLNWEIDEETKIVKVSFKMDVEDIIHSEIMQILPVPFAKRMVQSLIADTIPAHEENNEIHEEKNISIKESSTIDTDIKGEAVSKENMIPIKPVIFSKFNDDKADSCSNKIDLILDVPLEVTVELGRTNKLIKEVLSLGPGSIIELDKLAGEPVDILVNGKFIAKGEVVVIDENFGVRVTEIVSPVERVNKLQ